MLGTCCVEDRSLLVRGKGLSQLQGQLRVLSGDVAKSARLFLLELVGDAVRARDLAHEQVLRLSHVPVPLGPARGQNVTILLLIKGAD